MLSGQVTHIRLARRWEILPHGDQNQGKQSGAVLKVDVIAGEATFLRLPAIVSGRPGKQVTHLWR
jgi:hypothetical protein